MKTDFMHRTITIERDLPVDKRGDVTRDERTIKVKASRTRTTAGYASISIQLNDNCTGRVETLGATLTINTDAFGSAYEQVAFIIAEVLNEIASDKCALPDEPPKGENK